MAAKTPDQQNRLTIYLPDDVARRLKLAAANQKRAASEVAAELLAKHLPHLDVREKSKKTNIPYA